MKSTLNQYLITLENFGKFKVSAENIFHALDIIKTRIQKKTVSFVKTNEIKPITAFVSIQKNLVDVSHYII